MKKITRLESEKFIEKYKTDTRVLDVGSARRPYKKWYPNGVSLDIDPQSGADIIADAHKMPFKDSEFDFILCTEMLEHMYNPQQAVDEIYRVLKPGGRVLVTTRFIYPIHEAPHDYFRYTKYGLQYLLKQFEILELKEETTNFHTFAALFQRMIFQSRFRFDRLTKIMLWCLMKIFPFFNCLIVEQYTDIRRSSVEKNIFATGYMVIVQKK